MSSTISVGSNWILEDPEPIIHAFESTRLPVPFVCKFDRQLQQFHVTCHSAERDCVLTDLAKVATDYIESEIKAKAPDLSDDMLWVRRIMAMSSASTNAEATDTLSELKTNEITPKYGRKIREVRSGLRSVKELWRMVEEEDRFEQRRTSPSEQALISHESFKSHWQSKLPVENIDRAFASNVLHAIGIATSSTVERNGSHFTLRADTAQSAEAAVRKLNVLQDAAAFPQQSLTFDVLDNENDPDNHFQLRVADLPIDYDFLSTNSFSQSHYELFSVHYDQIQEYWTVQRNTRRKNPAHTRSDMWPDNYSFKFGPENLGPQFDPVMQDSTADTQRHPPGTKVAQIVNWTEQVATNDQVDPFSKAQKSKETLSRTTYKEPIRTLRVPKFSASSQAEPGTSTSSRATAQPAMPDLQPFLDEPTSEDLTSMPDILSTMEWPEDEWRPYEASQASEQPVTGFVSGSQPTEDLAWGSQPDTSLPWDVVRPTHITHNAQTTSRRDVGKSRNRGGYSGQFPPLSGVGQSRGRGGYSDQNLLRPGSGHSGSRGDPIGRGRGVPASHVRASGRGRGTPRGNHQGPPSTEAGAAGNTRQSYADAISGPRIPTRQDSHKPRDKVQAQDERQSRQSTNLQPLLAPYKRKSAPRERDYMAAVLKSLNRIFTVAQTKYLSKVSLEFEIGKLYTAIDSVSDRYKLRTGESVPYGADHWPYIYRTPGNGPGIANVPFATKLTSAWIDAEYLANLTSDAGTTLFITGTDPLDSMPGTSNRVELHCEDRRTSELVTVIVGPDGQTAMSRPGEGIGNVNVHFPRREWDASIRVKAALCLSREAGMKFRPLIDNLWIRGPKDQNGHNENQPFLFTKTGDRDIKIISAHLHRTVIYSSNPRIMDGVEMHVTAVDKFKVKEVKDRVEAAPLPIGRTTENSWWQAKLVSPSLNTMFKEHERLGIGEKSSYRAEDHETALRNLVKMMKLIMPKIDNVGYYNLVHLRKLASRTVASTLGGQDITSTYLPT